MKKVLLIFCLILSSSVAFAGEKQHRALAEELIQLTEGDKVMENMQGQVSMIFKQIVAQMNVPTEKKDRLEVYNKRFKGILKNDLSWETVRPQYLDLYTKTFTEKELKTLVDFYKSPLGKKLSEKMPALMQESMKISSDHMQTVVPKLETLTKDMQKEFVPQPVSAPAPEKGKTEKAKPTKK